jgi:hypothetical protein
MIGLAKDKIGQDLEESGHSVITIQSWNHIKLHSGYQVSPPTFRPNTARVEISNVTAPPTCLALGGGGEVLLPGSHFVRLCSVPLDSFNQDNGRFIFQEQTYKHIDSEILLVSGSDEVISVPN